VNAIDALARLRRLGVPVVTTAEAGAALGQRTAAASQTLSRLARAQHVRLVCHGLWWIEGEIDPLRLPEYLTAPLSSYVSLHTALHRRGMIEQIPEVVYAVSLARTQRVTTCAGTISIHHVAPEIFGGFEELASGVELATTEKALFDFAYLSAGRSRLFTSLPELELPRGFRKRELEVWLRRLPAGRARTLAEHKLRMFLTRRL
jgi:predicted transcriptional regulator of viral defense system